VQTDGRLTSASYRRRLTRREYPHLCLGRDARHLTGEVPRRIAEWVRPEPCERERIERSPVDRDRDARPDPLDGFARAPWIEVAGPEPRPPTPDRQEGHIDGPGETVHLGTQVRVTGKVQTRAPGDPVPERFGVGAERTSSPVVFGAYRLNRDAADAESLAGRDLRDVMTVPTHEPSKSFWHDDPRPAAKAPNGRQVQVIMMRMRYEDDIHVDILDEVVHGRRVALEQAQAIHEQRVGENADAIHLNEDS
jgi:hypothetical protein